LLTNALNDKFEKTITAIFAAAAVSCYYWYRIPSLIGFGRYPDDGLLVNISTLIPYEAVRGIIILVTLFFFWWLVVRKPNKASWVIRPEFAQG
jgi:hypothetical protein